MLRLRSIAVALACVLVLIMRYKQGARNALHLFVAETALAIHEGGEYNYTVRGTNERSLMSLTMLTEEEYAFGLLLSGVVTVKKGKDGPYVISSKIMWEGLLRGLETDDNLLKGEGWNLAEVHSSRIKLSKFKRVTEMEEKDTLPSVLTVRIGRPPDGEALVASAQLTFDVKPPTNRGLRRMQRELCATLNRLYKDTLVDLEDNEDGLRKLEAQIEAVIDWVDWDDLKEDPIAYSGDAKKYGNRTKGAAQADAPGQVVNKSGVDRKSNDNIAAEVDLKLKGSAMEVDSKGASATHDNEPADMLAGNGESTVKPNMYGKGNKADTNIDKGGLFGDTRSGAAAEASKKFVSPDKVAQDFTREEQTTLMSNLLVLAKKDRELHQSLKGLANQSPEELAVMMNPLAPDAIVTSIPTPKRQRIYDPPHRNATKYPMLNSLNVDLMDVNANSKREAVLRELDAWYREHEKPMSFETSNHYKFLFIKVPVGKPLDSSYRVMKEYQMIEKFLEATFEGDDTLAKVECMLDYLLIRHKEAARHALENMGIIPKAMDVYEMASTMDHVSIGIKQWRSLVQCLKKFMHIDNVSVSEHAWRKLGSDVGAIKSGSHEFVKNKSKGTRTEKAVYWTMDPKAECERNIDDFANSNGNFHPNQVKFIQTIYAGDHGQGKHRFACKNVIHLESPDGKGGVKRDKQTVIYPLADIKASKDTCEVFKATIHEDLAEGINQIVHGKVLFELVDEEEEDRPKSKRWKCTVIDKNHDRFNDEVPASDGSAVLDITPYMVGDLKFYSQMLGKEGFDSWWCYHCNLGLSEWQGFPGSEGTPWTLESLKIQADKNKRDKLTGSNRMGVREEYPYFDIPVENYIFPILHTLIGVGNNILTYLTNYADNHVQILPTRQITLKEEIKKLDKEILDNQISRNFFDDTSSSSSGASAIKNLKFNIRNWRGDLVAIESAGQVDQTRQAAIKSKIDDAEKGIKRLEDERKAMTKEIDGLKKKRTSKGEQITNIKKARKLDANSLYTGIDNILQEFSIVRAEYHGGDLTGVHIKIFMANAKEIMSRIRDYLTKSLHDDSDETPDSIKDVCNNVENLLVLWEGVLSNLHIEFPEEKDFIETQQFVDAAVELSFKMGMSKTVKGHGAQRHIVKQMRAVYGGLFEFDEQWAERIHQIGKNYDMKYRYQNEYRKAMTRAMETRRLSKPQTLAATASLATFKRGKRKAVIAKQRSDKRVKSERRSAALNNKM